MSGERAARVPPRWRGAPPDPVDETWRADAACLGVGDQADEDGGSMFHPGQGQSPREAQRVCRALCPVRAQCLADAMEPDLVYGVRAPYGVRGGETAARRSHIVSGRRPWPTDLTPPAGSRWARAAAEGDAA